MSECYINIFVELLMSDMCGFGFLFYILRYSVVSETTLVIHLELQKVGESLPS